MMFLSDGLLLIAAIVASAYCIVLSRRLAKLNGLDEGVGKAILTLSTQVDELSAALAKAEKATAESEARLQKTAISASAVADRLEALMAEASSEQIAANEFDPEKSENSDLLENSAEDKVDKAGRDISGVETTEPEPPTNNRAAIEETIDVIRKARDSDDDDAFAVRLVDALSALQPAREASAV